MGQSLTNANQESQDIQLFTSLAQQSSSNLHHESPSNDQKKRMPTTLKSTRSSEYRVKDFKRPFQHKKRITTMYIYDPDSVENEDKLHLFGRSQELPAKSIAAREVQRHGMKQLWTASTDKTIICWNLRTGMPNTLFQGHTDTISCLKIRDSLLFSASYDRTIRIWDLTEKHKHCIDVIQDQENWLCALELWKNYVICAGYARNINIYELSTKQKILSLKGHQKRIEHLVVDDCILYSCGLDGTIRLWDLEQGGACIRVLHTRDQCTKIDIWNENFLLIGQQEDVLCWNLDSTDMSTPQQQAIFVGISIYCIYDFLLIGWNRGKKQFEFWNIYNTIQKDLKNEQDKISLEYPRLVHVISTDVLMCTALYFVPGVLFYVSGTQVHSIPILLDIERERERIFGNSESQDTPSSIRALDSESVSNDKGDTIHADHGHKSDPKVKQPAYSLYPDLFHYFTDTLLHPTSKIADAIEKLHMSDKLSSSFDSQVNALGQYLRSNQHRVIQSNDSISLSSVDFKIFLNSKQETEHGPLPEVYSKEDYSLDFESRIDLFYKQLQALTTDVIQPTVIVVRREELVFDACKHFTQLSYADLKRPLYIFFANEKGLDSGGLAAEFYRLIGEEIFNENNALFENKGKNTYFPNTRSSINETHLQYFKFAGRVVGKAIFDMQRMNTHFSSVLFKYLIGKVVTFSDLQAVDRTLYLSLKRILEMEDVDDLQLEFSAEIDDFGKSNTYYLLDTDSTTDFSVTTKNKFKFVELLSRWVLIESVRYQVEMFLEGVYEVIPKPYFKIFNETEIELLLCGNPCIDIDDWKEHTHVEGFEENDKNIQIFWDAIESLSESNRGKVLSFVCGTPNPPVGGFVNLHPTFCISKLHGATRDHLPHAQTCINRISIPSGYDSVEWCVEKLMKAVEGGHSFEFV